MEMLLANTSTPAVLMVKSLAVTLKFSKEVLTAPRSPFKITPPAAPALRVRSWVLSVSAVTALRVMSSLPPPGVVNPALPVRVKAPAPLNVKAPEVLMVRLPPKFVAVLEL